MKAYVVTSVRDADRPLCVVQIGDGTERALDLRGTTLLDAADAILRAHTGRAWDVSQVAALAAMVFPAGAGRSVTVTLKGAQIDRFVEAAGRAAAC